MLKTLLLALLGVITIATVVLGEITAVGMTFVGNQAQPSIATAQFFETHPDVDNSTPVELTMFLPGTPTAYTNNIHCFLELSMDSYKPAQNRVFPIPVSVAPSSTANLVAISGKTVLGNKDVLGKFQFTCEFVAPNVVMRSVTVYTTVKARNQVVNVSSLGMINPWSSAFTSFQAMLGNGSKKTVFGFSGIGQNLSGNSFVVTNSNPEGTSSTSVQFIGPEKSYCDGYWNDILYEKSLVAQVSSDGSSITFLLGSPLNAATSLTVVCPNVLGFARNPYMPSLLKAVYPSPNGNLLTFALAF